MVSGRNGEDMARVLVLDVLDGKGLYEADCTELDDYYKHLKCSTFDVARRKIGDRYFDLFVDDIGLFSDDPIVSVYDEHMNPMLVGNVIIANHDSMGETTSLSNEDIKMINENVICAMYLDNEKRISRNIILAEY